MSKLSGKGISDLVLGEMGYKYGDLFMLGEHTPMKIEKSSFYATINSTQFMDGSKTQRSYLIVNELKFYVYNDKLSCLRELKVAHYGS